MCLQSIDEHQNCCSTGMCSTRASDVGNGLVYEGRHLDIVPEYKDWDTEHNASQPLDQHLGEALRILFRQGVEEISAQEIE